MKIDTRKLSAEHQEDKRLLAVKLYEKRHTQSEIGELLCVHRDTVGKWIRKARQQGVDSLKAKRRGRRKGVGRSLTPEDEAYIRNRIIDQRPDQLKMNYALWTRGAVVQLIRDELGLNLAIRTVGEYLKRWGMTPQKPLKRAYEQNPKAVQAWQERTYPSIKKKRNGKMRRFTGAMKPACVATASMAVGIHPKGKHR